IDRDVNVVPARDPSLVAASVIDTLRRVALNAGDALAGASMDASQLLDVDVDQLARPRSFIAKRGLEAQPAELAHSQPLADRADGRQRQIQQLAELWRREAQPSQRCDQLLGPGARLVGHPSRRRRAIQQSRLALRTPPSNPLAGGPLTDP